MTDRSDDAIRADLAKLQKPATGYHDVRIALDQARLARERLAADVAPLLARAVAAEARAEKAELEKASLADHAGRLLAERANAFARAVNAEAERDALVACAAKNNPRRRMSGIPTRDNWCSCAQDAAWLAEWCPHCEAILQAADDTDPE